MLFVVIIPIFVAFMFAKCGNGGCSSSEDFLTSIAFLPIVPLLYLLQLVGVRVESTHWLIVLISVAVFVFCEGAFIGFLYGKIKNWNKVSQIS